MMSAKLSYCGNRLGHSSSLTCLLLLLYMLVLILNTNVIAVPQHDDCVDKGVLGCETRRMVGLCG
jgi:hypothetical protein